MLDKTLPYFHIIMKRKAGLPIAQHALPAEFSLSAFVPGDEMEWAHIETAVGEFMTADEALAYFQETYLPHRNELIRRCMFVRRDDGRAVGTITSWWNTTEERRDPSVHWLAVLPDYQGLGLGKALVSECLQRLVWLEGDRDIFLHTQTWSLIRQLQST
ncbi:acetyltransferase, GNAT family [Sulfobacillus acidophilus TPY]|uniref:GCN5-related N-acetyltransferase n=1 Tax=Sulfobacillus acidophilus (strain ATCC 700253 / DSM 10332 / NAL) TaxID=679936 RepID=G8TY72_SULAD|nr:acetyltransferase, GNAT family [Sulfobacillus acidophilus TPY]AEW03979.1 GCN5-related N-acetyltransferase [Sulfobacillus acidophilus DSM 10332]